MADRGEWRELEREAYEVGTASLDDEAANPPEVGTLVAWTETCHGWTDGFSAVHRVGQVSAGAATTLCGEAVPEPIRRVQASILTPRFVGVLGRCRWCEKAYTKTEAA